MDSRAKKCPHCHEFQAGCMASAGKAFMLLAIVFFAFAAWQLVSLAFRKPPIPLPIEEPLTRSDYKGQVEVVEPRLAFRETGSCPQILVYCTAINTGKHGVRNLQYSAEFIDANGVMFDIDTDNQYATTVDANSSLPVKISFSRDFAKERYKDVKISVTHVEVIREY